MNSNLSIYGGFGFIGSHYYNIFGGNKILKEENKPKSNEILYFISTVDNYNIFNDPYKDINTNLIKMIQVLEECKNFSKDITFNFISSWFVYGMNASLNTKETDYCDPRGFYSITKRAAEQLLISYCDTYKINYRILRLTNIIGIGDKKTSLKKNALQHMLYKLKNNEEINLYDNGTNIRDFMDVSDACKAINICLKNSPKNEIINISNFEPIKIGTVINYAKNCLNSNSIIKHIEAPEFHKIVQIKNVSLNNNKLLEYGYKPSINTLQSVDNILKFI